MIHSWGLLAACLILPAIWGSIVAAAVNRLWTGRPRQPAPNQADRQSVDYQI